MPTVNGTIGNDGFNRSDADLIIHGLGGNDYIRITGGNSEAYGDEDDDTLLSQPTTGATTLLDGGDGNDNLLLDTSSASLVATLRGGSGNDIIESRGGAHVDVDAGDGDDSLLLNVARYVGFNFISHTTFNVTLGSGSDRVVLGVVSTIVGRASLDDVFVFTDFQAGAGGDQFNLDSLFLAYSSFPILTNWSGDNPFGTGHLRLVQSGADTILQIDADGAGAGGSGTFATFQNVLASSLTAFNFDGLAPDGSFTGQTFVGTPAGETITGGYGDDLIQGLGGDDWLIGGIGRDRLEGGDGADRLEGGLGSDLLYGGAGDDTLIDNASGDDQLFGEGGDDILQFSRPTSSASNPANAILDGGDGNDTLTAGGRVVDHVTLIGGNGNDRFIVNGSAQVTVTTGSGSDSVQNSSSTGGSLTVTDFTIGDGGDRLVIAPLAATPGQIFAVQSGANTIIQGITLLNVNAGFLTAFNTNGHWITTIDGLTTTDDTLIGNDIDNTLRGYGGDDFIDGRGGNDLMLGGAGNDVYVVSQGGDRVVEAFNEGFDVVYSDINFALEYNSSVELLSARDWYATTPLELRGNNIANILYGNAGANFLDGGEGQDSMHGLAGDDIYVVDDAGDNVYEIAGEGRDTVYATVDYALSETTDVEVLSARDWSATTPLSLSGNGLANELYGNAVNNFLDGRGGADIMVGFGGNDVYIVDNAGDVVYESAGDGTDIVFTSTTWHLTAGSAVEILSTRDQSAATAIDLYGNELANELAGNAGVNRLDGGAGADILSGFGGADTFTFTTALGGGNVDWITDFEHAVDRIGLDSGVFAGLTAVTADNFVVGSAALDSDDRIIFDSSTGALYFDVDGIGGQAAVQFASLSGNAGLTWSDLFVLPTASALESVSESIAGPHGSDNLLSRPEFQAGSDYQLYLAHDFTPPVVLPDWFL